MTQITVAAFYHFSPVADPAALKGPVQDHLRSLGIMGTVLVAPEGINGTIAGSAAAIDDALVYLRGLPGFAGLDHKISHADDMPFYRMKVRLKKEIVTMGVQGVDPANLVGTYVDPLDWNSLISDPDTIVVDTRNKYEVSIGTFDGAIDPETDSFRDFPTWVKDNEDRLAGKKIAMFCTGGIRCEKSTSYLKQQGYEDVYHLKGGILKYLELVPEKESRFAGECFVFDQRVSVKHGLELGQYDLCHACRHPITEEEKQSPDYQPGVSCTRCIDAKSEAQKKRYATRQHQINLSKARGEKHIGQEHQLGAPSEDDGFVDDPTDALLADILAKPR